MENNFSLDDLEVEVASAGLGVAGSVTEVLAAWALV